MPETNTKVFTASKEDKKFYQISHPFTSVIFVDDFKDAEKWANGLNNYRYKNVTQNLANKITSDKASAESLGNEYVYPTQEEVTKFDLAYRPGTGGGGGRRRDPVTTGIITMHMDAIKEQIITDGRFKVGPGGYTDAAIRKQALLNVDSEPELTEDFRTLVVESLNKQKELNTKALIDLPPAE